MEKLEVSERRACKVLGQPRSSQRYQALRPALDVELVRRLHELSAENPRFGYRRITALLDREGWRVNRKRVQRLWREEGLKVPQRVIKRRRLGEAGNGCQRRVATAAHEVWALDFVMDATDDGRRLKILTVIDEASRYALSVHVTRSLTAQGVMRELERLMTIHGPPAFIRSDNGPEFIADAARSFLAASGVRTLFLVHRAGLAVAERLQRELQRPPARRALEPGALRDPARSGSPDRELEELLQPRTAARRAGVRHPRRSARRPD